MNCGIYIISCNNKHYIGRSINIKSRLYYHKKELIGNYHKNKHLQDAFNKYGESSFTFDVFEECEKEYLASQENYWCIMLDTHNRERGYNIEGTGPNGKSYLAKETRDKISTIKKELYKDPTKNPFFGRSHSEESIERIRKSGLGLKKRSHSEESKKARSERMKGHPNWNKANKVYPSTLLIID